MRQTSGNAFKDGHRQPSRALSLIVALFVSALLITPAAVLAQGDSNSQGGGNPRFEAWRHASLNACSYKSAGTTCSFSIDNHSFTGTCEATQHGNLACRNIVSKQGLDSQDGSFDNGMSAGDISQ
jgi:hypothetical protein